MMFKSLKQYFPLLFVLISFLLITLIVSPFGNYPVNDDWDFFLHVKYFSGGNFVKNSLIDAAFLLQGFIGLFWVKIFGLSFVSLRILTIIFTVILLLSIYLVLNTLKIPQIAKYFILFSILADPFLIFSAFSFMTEVYFLVFVTLSIYFFLKSKNPYTAIFFALLSCFIRQFGYILLLSYAIYYFKNEKNFRYVIISLISILVAFLGNFLFPAFTGYHDTIFEKLLSLFGNIQDFIEKILLLPKYLPYLAFTLLPLLLSVKTKLNRKLYLLLIPISAYLFFTDIFDLKNVFHLECFLCETDYVGSTSLFNNIPFKILFSGLISYSILKLGYLIYIIFKEKSYKEIQNSKIFVLIIFVSLTILAILLSDSFYDRYFLIVSLLTTIIFGVIFKDRIQNNYYSWISILFLLLFITMLNLDFHNSMKVRWELGEELYQKTNLKSQIYVTGTFNKFYNAINKSPEELLSPIKYGVQKCFVLRYVKSNDGSLEKFFDSKIFNNRYLKNPKFSNALDPNKLPSVKENLNSIISVKKYNSPIYNILGRETYFVSFCNPEVVNRYNIKTSSFSQ